MRGSIEQAELLDATGHLVPAIEIERGIGPDIDEPPAAATVALEPAKTILADGNGQNQYRETSAGGEQAERCLRMFFESRAPTCSRGSERAIPAQLSPSAAGQGENKRRR